MNNAFIGMKKSFMRYCLDSTRLDGNPPYPILIFPPHGRFLTTPKNNERRNVGDKALYDRR